MHEDCRQQNLQGPHPLTLNLCVRVYVCCRHDVEEESHKKHKKKKEKKRSLSPAVEAKIKKKEKVIEEPDAAVPR